MFKITMNEIYLTQGDTARFKIALADIAGSSTDYKLTASDQVYFIVTETPKIIPINTLSTPTPANANYLFYKTGLNVVLSPGDTSTLTPGKYYYQVRVVLSVSGDTNTIIEPTEFYITPSEEMI